MDAAIARILDANLNRAREAIRVLEEYARFGLNDADASGGLKSMRHELAAAVSAAGLLGVLAARNTPGDVGTELQGAGEYRRGGIGDVVAAAGKRLTEALRVLEEYGKTQSREFAVAVERLRYKAYDVEQRLVRQARASVRFADVRLYVLITERLCRGPWQGVLAAAAAGGATCFQLREPDMDDAALFARAEQFVGICRKEGVIAIVNNRADVAAAVGANGVHVGQRDLPASAARTVVGPDRLVGISTHDTAEFDAALAVLPDYIAVGPMFSTELKREYGVAGPGFLQQARARTALPLVAIGGITPQNARQLQGVRCVAACTSIIAADDPRRAAAELLAALG